MKIVGADACKDRLVFCCLEEFPDEPREAYHEKEFNVAYCDENGLKLLLETGAKHICWEPTGVHYVEFFRRRLLEAGWKVWEVHNSRLPNYREQLGLPDKDDEADALALACYWLQYRQSPRRFLVERGEATRELRLVSLQLQHINRQTNATINRLHQELTWQFPECSKVGKDANLFWGWLAGRRKSSRYDDILSVTQGEGITQETRLNAQILDLYLQQEQRLSVRLCHLARNDTFAPYWKVFDEFGFGDRVGALILSQIYPIENYLGPDGRPEVMISRGRNSGKPTKKRLSLRRFKKALGCAPAREWSGDKKKHRRAGSTLIATALWQWMFVHIEVARRKRSPRCENYRRILRGKMEGGTPAKKARADIRALVAKDLFYALVNSVNDLG